MHRFMFAILCCVFAAGNLTGQETFNKRYDFTYLAAVLTSVHPTDSCYYATGILADSLPPYATGNIFAKFDLSGELVHAKALTGPSLNYETWFNTLQPYQDSLFIIAGQLFDSVGKTILVKYDRFGNTLAVHQFLNPTFPNYDWMQPSGGMVRTNDGGFVVCNLISNNPSGNSDLYAMKVDEEGNLDWGTILPDGSGKMDIPRSVVIGEDGSIIMGAWRSNLNQVTENFTSQISLAQFTPDGVVGWLYLSPVNLGLLDGPNEMVLLPDGSLVIATGRGTEIERPTGNTIWFDKQVLKLNPGHEIEWEVTFEDDEPNSSSRLTNIVQLSDGSGFVVAGMEGEDLPGSDTYAVRGWFAKVSNEGQTVWIRTYVGIDGDQPRHAIYDIDETPDGGLIVCGESRDGTNETLPPQQGWLLKLDAHGCLIPGCHLLDATGEVEVPELELAIYPNPTSDYLNFQLRGGNVGRTASFRIVDLQGRVLRTFESATTGATHIVPVWDWVAGVYFLQYVEGGETRFSQKFIKQ